ncbi:predicted integral membrane protein [Blautia sp. CAG:257]|nr:predicted integral membrane protein [Blautia sp. CAG:257]
MAIRHLPFTFLMLLICACPILILFIPSFQIQMSLIMLVILFGPAVIAYGNSHFFVKIFDKYIPKELTPEETEVMP